MIPFTWCRFEVTEEEAERLVPVTAQLVDWFEKNARHELWFFHSPVYNVEIYGIAAVDNGEVVSEYTVSITHS